MNTYENAAVVLNAYKMTAYIVDGKLILQSKKQEEVIPLSKIQSASIRDPKGINYGVVTIYTAQANTASVGIGLGVSLSGGAQREILFTRENKDAAHQLHEYIANWEPASTAAAPQEGTVVSVVEEIRGLKQLLDEGILTQEEFDAKKKQLLGI